MPIENDIRKIAVDVREHLGHKVFADLPGIVTKSIRTSFIA